MEGKRPLDYRSLQLTSNKRIRAQLEDQSFWGRFMTTEVKVALENWYRIVDVADIRSWLISWFVCLFKKNMKKLKDKMEALGWPQLNRCGSQNSDTRENYLCDHKLAYLKEPEKQRITLDPLKVSKKEGLRFIAEIQLNRFWGLSRDAG